MLKDDEKILAFCFPNHACAADSRFFPQQNERRIQTKKRLKVSYENVTHGLDDRSSMMLKNIPTSISIKTIVKRIKKRCNIDYLYIPYDEATKKNLGFAFVNLKDCNDIIHLYDLLNQSNRSTLFRNVEICYSAIQGIPKLSEAFGEKYVIC